MKLDIVIPAYNEEKRIGSTLRAYLDYFRKIKELDFRIIVVLNGCRDNTRKVVEKYKSREIKILEFKQAGKGFAVAEGFKEALRGKAELIGFVDADCSTPPEAFYDLIRNIGNYDGAIANRWMRGSVIKTRQTFFRRMISRVFNFIVRVLFLLPHNDTQCGAKLFRREVLKKVVHKLGASEWSFDVDLLFYMRRIGARVKSVPTIWEDKKDSHINMKRTPPRMFLSVLRLRLVHSPFRFIVRWHGKLPHKMKVENILGING
jgi:glycosyltransferase involved in cell wall biosynthesis